MNKELLTAFKAVQKEMPVIKKNAKGFNYTYADLPQVWESIKEVLEKNGFIVTHKVEFGFLKTSAFHEHGELQSLIPFNPELMKPQEIGSEITYYKRYNICAIFNIIIEGEDDDAKTAQGKKQVKVPVTEKAPNCPDCNLPMKISGNTNRPYCPDSFKGKCPPAPKQPLDEVSQRISDELDDIPVI